VDACRLPGLAGGAVTPAGDTAARVVGGISAAGLARWTVWQRRAPR
jgi:hypothetical protein